MLNINQEIIAKLDVQMLEKQKNLLRIIAVLMFISGVLLIVYPFISGEILAMILGIVLICSCIAYAAIMIKNRLHNFWPVVSGVLICIAYAVMGYLFITAPAFEFLHFADSSKKPRHTMIFFQRQDIYIYILNKK